VFGRLRRPDEGGLRGWSSRKHYGQRSAADQFYGDGSATLEDPFGQRWTVATHIEDMMPVEIKRRMESMTQA
jgi:hypothetical protein